MPTVIPVQEPVFASTSGQTFDAYCQAQPTETQRLLRRILAERRIDPDTQRYLATYPVWLTAILLVEDQTPDTVVMTPTLARIADACPRLELRVVSDRTDLSALNELVDDALDLEEDLDDLDLPLLFFFDEEWNQQARWGPRPAAAEARLDEWLAAHPVYERMLEEDCSEMEELVDQLTHQMRLWCNDDLTAACIGEIRDILATLETN